MILATAFSLRWFSSRVLKKQVVHIIQVVVESCLGSSVATASLLLVFQATCFGTECIIYFVRSAYQPSWWKKVNLFSSSISSLSGKFEHIVGSLTIKYMYCRSCKNLQSHWAVTTVKNMTNIGQEILNTIPNIQYMQKLNYLNPFNCLVMIYFLTVPRLNA